MGTTAGGARHAGEPPSLPGRRSYNAPVAGEAVEANIGDMALTSEVRLQHRRSMRRQPVGASAIVALHRLDQPLTLEAAERLVQRARGEPHTGKFLNVLREEVTVLGAVRQAGEDQRRRAGVATE